MRWAALLAAGLAGSALAASDASAQFFFTTSGATYETGDEPRVDPGENAAITHTIWVTGAEDLTDLTFTVDYEAALTGARLDLGSISSFSCGTPTISSDGLGLVTVSNIDPVGQCQVRYSVSTPASTAAATYVASPSNITGTGSVSGAIDRDWADFNIEVGVDSAAPAPIITGPGGPVDAAFNVNVSFVELGLYAETIDGFAVSDLVVTNATVAFADLGGDGVQSGDDVSTVTIEVTPTGAGTPITVELPAATVVDQSGNDNTASNVYSVVYDVGGDPRDDVDFTASFVTSPVDPLDQATLRFTITNNSADDLTVGQFDLDIDGSSSSDFFGVQPAALPCGPSSTATLSSGNTYVQFRSMALVAGASCTFDLPIEVDDALEAGNYGFTTTELIYNLDAVSYTDTQAAAILAVDFAEGAGGTIQFTKTFAEDDVAPGDTIDVEFYIAATGAFTTTDIVFTDDLDAMLGSATATGTPLADVCGAGSSLTGTSVLSLAGGSLASEGSCTFTVTVSVPAGAAAGTYTNTTSNLTATRSDDGAVTIDPASDSFVVDVPGGTPPSVTISGDTDDLGVAFSRALAVRFSEPVTDLVAGDFDLTNATSDGLTGSGSDWTLTVSPAGVGSVEVFLPAAVVQDAEGDDNALSNTFTFEAVAGDPEINVTGNSVSIADGAAAPSLTDHTQFSPVDVTAGTASRTFTIENLGTDTLTIASVALSGADSADFSITSAAAASVAPAATTSFTVQFDPSVAASRTATITITSNDADEASYDFAIAGVGTVLPEIRLADAANAIDIDSADASPSVADGTDFGSQAVDSGTASATFTINNDGGAVLTLGSDAVTISGSDAFSVTAQPATTVAAGNSTTFTIEFDPAEAGTSNATVSIANDDSDEAPYLFGITGLGTDNVAPSGHTVSFDSTLYGPSNYTAASFTIDNPETLTDFSYTISSDGGGANVVGTGSIPIPNAGDPAEFQVSGLDISGLNEGELTVSVVLTDASSNAAAAVTDTATLDLTGPTPVISTGSADPVSGAFTIAVDFGEAVTGFLVGDISVGNGALSAFADNGGGDFSATLTPAADGTVTVDVASAAAQDAAGNDSVAATQFTIENDETAPTVALSTGSADPVSGAFTITATFSEAVTGFAIGDFSVGNGAASNFSATSATVYTATITPAADGTVTVDVAGAVAQDGAGNNNTAATQFSIENDETVPTVALTSGAADPVSGAFTITATFSEAVTGFAIGDFSVGNGAASSFSATSATVYTATITPAADGTVTVDVAAAAAQDSAGNNNTAATQFSIESDGTSPTVALTTGSADPVSGAFTITATFSEAVTGFAIGDFSVGNGAASSFSATSTTVYTATITPAADGTVTVDVAAAAAQDSAGNGNTAATQFTIENDETGPTVALTSGASDPVSGAFTITATFSEAVTGFAIGDFSVGNGAASNFSATSATVYTATITPAADGTVTVDVAAAAAQDSAGNNNTAATQFSIENDETVPTVALTSGASDPTSGAFTITATFSEAVTGFAIGDFSVGNGAASNFSATSATVYTATITPAADGTVTVDVAAAAAQDSAGNNNTAATQFTIENDETVPTVALSTGSADPVSGAFTITATFSEAVTGFAIGDFSVGNGAASSFSATSATVYTATITPAADGSVTVDVAAAAAQDSAGNNNTAATQFSIENDETVPTITLTSGASDPVSGAFTITATFSEAVTGFAIGDFSVGNGAASNFSATSATVYTATITPAADGTVTVDVAAAAAQDSAGNNNTAATQFSIENDETVPTVALTSGASDPTSGAFTITATFSEAVTGFAIGDFSVGNGAASSFSATSATVYTATITPAADGTVTVDVAGAVAQDGAGNGNTAATQFSIEYDATGPTLALTTGSADPVSGAFTITATFSEAVTGFAIGDFSVGNGAASSFSATSATVYTATITPAADGTVTVDVAAAAAQDGAGNGNVAATQFTIENDETGPTVALTTGSADPTSGAFTITATFSEAVTGFAIGDFSVGNGAASSFSATSATVYTATITPAADGSVTVDVAAAAAQDSAGNNNTAATQFTIENDETVPTVALTTGSADPVSGAFTITATFSEAVTGFAIGDFSVGNGAASNFSATSATVYTATITPAADGTVTVDVAGSAAQDSAGNGNTAATQFTIENDGTSPTVALTTGSADPVSGAFTITATFSEAVTGFAIGDFSVGNGAASNFSATSATVYTATITPAADGTVTVDVAAAAAQDSAGNGNVAATQFSIENDETGPTIALSTGSADPVSGAFTITATFSEAVTGFAIGDFSVGNGAASSFSATSATVYTATITPAADGTVTVDVAGGAAQDSAGNGNTAATQFSIENDGTSPTVALSTGSADPVSGAFTITATFSEAVTGFAIGDFSVGNGAASNFSATSATVYTATITPAADGTVTVDVAAAAAQDGAGNGNVAATQFSIENDETGPTVALSTGSADPVSGAFTITATFSEAVTGFAIGDFSVGNGAASSFSATSATVYTATITPAADGTVTVDVAGSAAQDSAGNGNTAATQFSIENDETAPTVALDGPAIDQVGTFTLSVDFSEGVTGLVLADFTVGNGSAANLAGSGSSYTLDITPTASGPVTVDLAANSAQDAAGNGNVAATQFAVDADLSLPELDSLVVSDVDIRIEDVGGSVTLTATFSEAMDASQTPVFTFSTDLSATLSLDNGAFSAGNTVYTATYSVADGGQVAADVDVTVSAAADAAGNALPDSPVADLLSVEMRRGSLSVAVAITGGTDGSFDFSGDLGDFSVATTSQAGATSFDDLAEGSYTFTAAATDGFNLDAISCTGGTFVLDAVAGSATVTLGPTDTVSCEFTQVAEPDVDETVIPVVTIELPTLADDPTSTTSSFDLQNVGGEAFYFTASTDQPWLAIDPTAGSIPATGSLEFTVSFTSAVLDLAPGAYTATITVVEVSPPAQRGGGSKANTLETLEIPVNIAIEPRLGDLTIITSTTAPEEGEGSFSYASTLTALDGQTVTTTGGSASTTVNDVLRGSYVLTQLASEGWDLASLSCTGDLDGGNVYDLASGQVTIDLDAEENMVCTFTNRRNEDYIRGVTLSAIRNFMATRADLILTNSPRLAGRMRSDRSSATPNSFAADFRDGRLNAQMSTSLSALRQAVEASQPQQPGDERFSLNGRTGMSSLDVWMQASVASVSDNRAGLGSDADFSIVHVGTDIMVSENVLAGVLIQYDQTDMTTGDWNSAVEGNGWMAGPYMVARISDHTYLDLRAAWGQSDNSVNPIGTYTDSFETDRWLIEANLAGDILHGGWRVTPGVGLAYFHESQDAYTDTLGIVIPGQTITIGRLSAGPEVAYRFENAAGGYVEPYLNVTALYDYDDADVFNAAGTLQTLGHLRGDARLGLTMEMANGGRISGEVSMIGLGEGDFEANSAMLRIRLPLSMH